MIKRIEYNIRNGYALSPRYGLIESKEVFVNDYNIASRLYQNYLVPQEAFEKVEMENVDDKMHFRWSTRFLMNDYDDAYEAPFRRFQSGIIFQPEAIKLQNSKKPADLLVFYSDYHDIDISKYYDSYLQKMWEKEKKRPKGQYRTERRAEQCQLVKWSEYPVLFSSITIWQEIIVPEIRYQPLGNTYAVAILSKSGAQDLLELPKIIVDTVLWTDDYELPQLKVSAINDTCESLATAIERMQEYIFWEPRKASKERED